MSSIVRLLGCDSQTPRAFFRNAAIIWLGRGVALAAAEQSGSSADNSSLAGRLCASGNITIAPDGNNSLAQLYRWFAYANVPVYVLQRCCTVIQPVLQRTMESFANAVNASSNTETIDSREIVMHTSGSSGLTILANTTAPAMYADFIADCAPSFNCLLSDDSNVTSEWSECLTIRPAYSDGSAIVMGVLLLIAVTCGIGIRLYLRCVILAAEHETDDEENFLRIPNEVAMLPVGSQGIAAEESENNAYELDDYGNIIN